MTDQTPVQSQLPTETCCRKDPGRDSEPLPTKEAAKETAGDKGARGNTGVMLVNLGTPDGTDYWSMRRYLKEFLSDPRVIETNRVLWWFILNVIILTFRPTKSGEAYKSIWNKERDESPLRTITRAQAEKLRKIFASQPNLRVTWGMRYGCPCIGKGLRDLAQMGCDKIILFPLYPQYSASTTATVCDKAFEKLKNYRNQPSIRVVPPYYNHPKYITALANSIRAALSALSWQPECVLASFHGLPLEYAQKGDPYPEHCKITTDLLRRELGWEDDKLLLTFQSRFGPAEWLQPYTDKTIEQLGQKGIKNLAVITPGFAADCVETLEEIAILNREVFEEHGGENYALIPCLNDSDESIELLEELTRNEMQGWV